MRDDTGHGPAMAGILGAEGHEVWGAPGNSQFTLFTLASLGSWLTAFPEPDVVHWNNDLTTSVHPDRPFRDDQWSCAMRRSTPTMTPLDW